MLTDWEKIKKDRKQDFETLAKIAEEFINKWGNPHTTIIIMQGSIEMLESEIALPLEIED